LRPPPKTRTLRAAWVCMCVFVDSMSKCMYDL
jgi:hypothetical protein